MEQNGVPRWLKEEAPLGVKFLEKLGFAWDDSKNAFVKVLGDVWLIKISPMDVKAPIADLMQHRIVKIALMQIDAEKRL